MINLIQASRYTNSDIDYMNPAQEKHIFQSILVKFVVNLPSPELEDPNRLAYQTEKAFYYYLDEVLNKSQP